MRPGIRLVHSRHHPGRGQPVEELSCRVIQEDALTIDVEDIGTYTLIGGLSAVAADLALATTRSRKD